MTDNSNSQITDTATAKDNSQTINPNTNSPVKLIMLITIAPLILAGFSLAGFSFGQGDWLTDLIQTLHDFGALGMIGFLIIYAIATSLVLPATALNLAAGTIYGISEGLLLATLGAWLSAMLSFTVARWIAPNAVHQWLNRYPNVRENIETELVNGGLGYGIACRLLPIVPYGIVSVVAGLSNFPRRDYIWGTVIGTPFGLISFVWLGVVGKNTLNASLGATQSGITPQIWLEIVLAMAAVALLVAAGTWYRQQRRQDMSNPIPKND